MISNIFVSLYVFPGPAVGTDGQRQAVKSIECSKNNQDISLDSVLLVLLDVLLFVCNFVVMRPIGGLIVDALEPANRISGCLPLSASGRSSCCLMKM